MDSERGKAEVAHAEDGDRSSREDIDEVLKEGHNGIDASARSNPRLDKRGLPLIPQPTDRKDDPLVCYILTKTSPSMLT